MYIDLFDELNVWYNQIEDFVKGGMNMWEKTKSFTNEHFKFLFAVILSVLLASTFAYLTITTVINTRKELVDLDTSRSLNQYSLTLGQIFSKIDIIETFVLTSGIENITEDSFEYFAENTSFEGIGFASFSIAPDGVIAFYYSDFIEENLIGRDLVNDERDHVREAVQYAITNKLIVVNGPFDLLLGDEGIVFRKPVFVEGEFVGLINLVVEVETLNAQLNHFDTNRIITGVYDQNEDLVFGADDSGEIHETHAFAQIPFEYVNWHIGVRISDEYQQNTFWLTTFLSTGFAMIMIVVIFLWGHYYARNRRLIFEQQQLIYYDNLTKLPNRMLFIEETKSLLYNRTPFFLGFGDLDNFKNINDVLGHSVGDQYLSFLASHLEKMICENLKIYRWGGDEFIFVFINTEKDVLETTLDSIVEIFKQPFSVKETKHQISISIGLVEHPVDGSNIDDLVKRADIVMYDIKAQQKNTYNFFEQRHSDKLYNQLQFQQTLDEYKVEDFDVYLQPITDVKSGVTRGFEGLARLFSPEGKQFATQEIIKLYEHDGTITKLDKYVFDKICTYITECNQLDGKDLFFTFNISPLSLTEEFVDYLISTIESYAINPNWIIIEIIETLGFKDVKISIDLLNKIRAAGFKIAMDDFGMGYSSLSYITKLPLNLIKIDRSFVRDYENNTFNRTILYTIKDISNSLNLEILVEGIETQQQLDFITKLGAHYYQGYLHSKPMSYKDMKSFMKKQ